MKGTYISEGETIKWTNSGGTTVAYGTALVLGTKLGFAAEDIAASATGTVNTVGIYELPAETTAAFTVGEIVYWDDTNHILTATKGSLTAVAVVVTPKAQATATAQVQIR